MDSNDTKIDVTCENVNVGNESHNSAVNVAIKKKKKSAKKELLRLFRNIVILGTVIWATFTFMFAVNVNKGTEMYPALKDGDILFSYRLQQRLVKGDVVAYIVDDETHFGRIVAVAGDTVEITKNGTLKVNNTVQSEEIVFPTYPNDADISIQLEKDTYYILGDHRTTAVDSRTFGAISKNRIQSKVICVVRRRGV